MAAEVRNNPSASRYEIVLDGELVGVADYHVSGDSVVFPHTVIDPAHQGHGLGAKLVEAALDDVRRTGRGVVAECWYVRQFIAENPRYEDLLAA